MKPEQPSTRRILATTYAAEGEGHSHVILEIVLGNLPLIQRAMKFARQFDADEDHFYDQCSLTTGSVGGEHVLEFLTEDLEIYCGELGDPCAEIPRLMPRGTEAITDAAIAACASGDNRWGSQMVRYKCTADEVRAEVEDKYTADSYVWTRDIWPLLEALCKDFECEGFAVVDPDDQAPEAELSNVVLENVDPEMLESQRLALQQCIFAIRGEPSPITTEQLKALEGIENMLNNWSDKRVEVGA